MRTSILLIFLFVHHGLLVGQADAFIETISHAKQSIIPVACAAPDAEESVTIKEIKGTGFFVNYEGNFITAGHVIKDNFKWNKRGVEADMDCVPVIYVPKPSWQHVGWFKFGPCTVDETIDIAVCKTIYNPFSDSSLHLGRLHLFPATPADGTAVAVTGFPQLTALPVTSRGNVAGTGEFFANTTEIVIDKTTWHGVSGGPIYLANGAVIGMMTHIGENLWAGMAFGKPTSMILKFLSEKNIPVWHDEPTQGYPKKKTPRLPKSRYLAQKLALTERKWVVDV
jgi:hypothetical protein